MGKFLKTLKKKHNYHDNICLFVIIYEENRLHEYAFSPIWMTGFKICI
jgi:hypothetical protein